MAWHTVDLSLAETDTIGKTSIGFKIKPMGSNKSKNENRREAGMCRMKLRISIVQPYLPHYSAAFFEKLAEGHCIGNVQIIADLGTSGHLNAVGRADALELCHVPYIAHCGSVFRPGRLRALRSYRPDVCILSGDPRDLGSLFLALFLRFWGCKVVFWGMFHRIGGPRLVSQIIYRLMAKVSNACITYSRIGAHNLLSLGARAEKVFVGGTAIDERKPSEMTAELCLDDIVTFKLERGLLGKNVILQVVRLSRIKKPLLLLELARILKERGRKDFVIVVIGGGEMLEAFQDRARELALVDAGMVQILPPEYEESRLARWFLSADIFTIPTCIGLSAHHAFSYGVPIVTDDSLIDQASEFEVIAHGLNGLTYRAGDIEAYADAVETILDDPEMRARLSRNALDTVRNTFNLASKVEAFEHVFGHIFGDEYCPVDRS